LERRHPDGRADVDVGVPVVSLERRHPDGKADVHVGAPSVQAFVVAALAALDALKRALRTACAMNGTIA